MKNIRLLTNGLAIYLFAIAIIFSSGEYAKAHELDFGQVAVEHPWALPARAGGSTRMYLIIENEGHSSIYFTGVKTPVASESSIMFQSDPGVERSLDSITVPTDESLNFGTSHMWIALRNLRQDLNEGDSFPAALEFGEGRQILVIVTVGKVH